MAGYTVSVANTFEAESPEDAVAQMAAWLVDYAYGAGYRVVPEDGGESVFIDAEDIDYQKMWEHQ
jgi:hypothetical protein